jgi:hypothetical protein
MSYALTAPAPFSRPVPPGRRALGQILARQRSFARPARVLGAYAVVTAALWVASAYAQPAAALTLVLAVFAPAIAIVTIAGWLSGRARAARFDDAVAFPAAIDAIFIRRILLNGAPTHYLVVRTPAGEATAALGGIADRDVCAALGYLYTIAPHAAPPIST